MPTPSLLQIPLEKKIEGHPCFNVLVHRKYGRVHLPVAPKCNIQCRYCLRNYDCVNESRPGVTSQVLDPNGGLERTLNVLAAYPWIRVIAIAGPGEPLANDKTFETLRLVKERLPEAPLCLSTNGLLLPDRLDLIEELGVRTLTVTLNTIDPEVGAKIYSYIQYGGKVYRGLEAATILRDNQLQGLKAAAERGIVLKVNSVLIPGVNEGGLVDVAKKAKELGAYTMNIMPIIPVPKTEFENVQPPTPTLRRELQKQCGAYLKQMLHCSQCRSDAVGLLGRDIKYGVWDEIQTNPKDNSPHCFRPCQTGTSNLEKELEEIGVGGDPTLDR